MNCYNEKNQHIGNLETLARFNIDGFNDKDAVVQWCPECGAVVIYKEYDCRMAGNYVKMKFPIITRKALKTNAM